MLCIELNSFWMMILLTMSRLYYLHEQDIFP